MHDSQTNELLLVADEFYYSSEYTQAIEIYEKILNLDPENSHAQEYLTKAKFFLLQADKERLSMSWYKRARSFIYAGDLDGAVKALRESIKVAYGADVPFPDAEKLLLQVYDSLTELKRPKVFISYSRADLNFATNIYFFLRENNCNPWMDIYDLVPGQDWEVEISHNIKSADYFIACLSRNSVSKRGYIQKELKEAISLLEQTPEGEIYIIPIRIDDCLVPISLARRQWLDWSKKDAKESLLKAIKSKK
jgi:tetratricopeptide (TPR) repeat protein